jgi:hypothetical protein
VDRAIGNVVDAVTRARGRPPAVLVTSDHGESLFEEGFIGHANRRLLSTLNRRKLERVLGYMLDEREFLSPFGIRSVSRFHKDHPFVFDVRAALRCTYAPANRTAMFWGNSGSGARSVRVNVLIIRAL